MFKHFLHHRNVAFVPSNHKQSSKKSLVMQHGKFNSETNVAMEFPALPIGSMHGIFTYIYNNISPLKTTKCSLNIRYMDGMGYL